MKYFSLFTFLVLFSVIYSCQKKECDINVEEGIEGVWIWTKWGGTIAGISVENIDNNENMKLIIKNNYFKEIQLDSIVFESKFIMNLDEGIITFESGLEKGIILNKDELEVRDLFPDGISKEFKKKCN